MRSIKYWDWNTSGTTGASSDSWNYHDDTSSTWSLSNATSYRWPVYYRRILVTDPECWTDEDGIAFVKLVNIETHTGWLVTMRIKGEILITDPNIETRTMEAFIPLLKAYAAGDDLATINEFLARHPLK